MKKPQLKLTLSGGDLSNDITITLKHGWALEELSDAVIEACLVHFNYNRSHAAEALQVATRTVRNRIGFMRLRGSLIPDNPRKDFGAAAMREKKKNKKKTLLRRTFFR